MHLYMIIVVYSSALTTVVIYNSCNKANKILSRAGERERKRERECRITQRIYPHINTYAGKSSAWKLGGCCQPGEMNGVNALCCL